MRNPAPDSSLCRAASRLRPLQLLLAACVGFSCCSRARLRHPLQLLLPVCLRFQQCCSPIGPLQLLLAACVRFSCCSRSRPLRLLLPDCVRFNCCSPIALAGFQPMPCPGPNILRGVRGSVNNCKSKVRRSRVTIV